MVSAESLGAQVAGLDMLYDMLSQALWEQVDSLSPDQKLELVERVEASLPAAPEAIVPHWTPDELRALISETVAEMATNPAAGIAAEGLSAQMRASLK